MNKAEFVSAVAEKLNLSRKQVKEVIETAIEVASESLKRGEDVRLLPDFGIFKVVERKARVGRDLQTGKKIKIPARKAVKFKPAKRLTERVR